MSQLHRVVGLAARRVLVCCAAICGLLAVPVATSVQAASFSVVPFTSAGDSGISAANTYTHALDFLGPGGVVNGVAFSAAPSQLGSNYSLINVPNAYNFGNPNLGALPPADPLRPLINDFFYGNGNDPETVILSGLTPGQWYSTRFYSIPWGGPRGQNVLGNHAGTAYDEDAQIQHLDYTYQAGGTTSAVTFTGFNAASMHQYMLTNQVVAPQASPFTPLTGLYNTGVDNAGQTLGTGVADPHYALVVNPDAPASTGAVVHNDQLFPIVTGPWVQTTSSSKWIAPRADAAPSAGGDYVYNTTFNLAGNPTTASLTGFWATDNDASAAGESLPQLGMFLNGTLVATNPNQFASYTRFSIPAGSPFVAGLNTLSFALNNAGAGWTGLRVEGLQGSILADPSYSRVSTLYNTGVDNANAVQADGTADTHWRINVSADAGFSAPGDAIVQTNHPAWLANSGVSKWVSTLSDGQANIANGDYVYETNFSLAGFDPATAFIDGQFAADNDVQAVLLNGNLVLSIAAGSGSYNFYTPFSITSGFVAGTNTLTFLMRNEPPADQGSQPNPGGFRVELSAFAAQQVPELSSLVLCGLGMLGLFGYCLRRRRG